MHWIVDSNLIESIVNTALNLDRATILTHEHRGQESNNTSLRGITLGQSLDEVSLLLFDEHVSLGLLESFLLCWAELADDDVLGEGGRCSAVLLALSLVEINNDIILWLEVESGCR